MKDFMVAISASLILSMTAGFAHDVADTPDDAEELCLLHGLEESLLASACTSHDLDRLLQSTKALLILGLVFLELCVFLVAHFRGFLLGFRILGKIFLQLGNFSSVRSQITVQLLNLCLEFFNRVFGLGDGRSLASKCVLAPASILVV